MWMGAMQTCFFCFLFFFFVFGFFFFFNDTATTEIYTLSLHDALPILGNSGTLLSTNDLDSMEDQFADVPVYEEYNALLHGASRKKT